MGTIIGGKFFDDYAVQYNGTDNGHYIDNPANKSNSAGCWAMDVMVKTMPAYPVASVILSLRTNNGGVFLISARKHAGYGDTNARFDIAAVAYTGQSTYGSGGDTTKPLPNTWYRLVVQSNGKMYINGVEQVLNDWGSGNWTGQWHSYMTGASAWRLNIGMNWVPGVGSPASYGNVRINNLISYNASLTAAEALADHNGGVAFDRRSNADLNAKLVEFWRFDENGNAEINSGNNLTAYGTPTYIAP